MPEQFKAGFRSRLAALILKEFRQIRRDRRIALSLVVPPTLQILLFGFALNSTVSNLRLGIVDDSRSPESRELVANMTESRSFRLTGVYLSSDDIGKAISLGKLDAGLLIPYDYARSLQRGRSADVQVLINAVNANTASIARGYTTGIIQTYNRTLRPLSAKGRGKIDLQASYLFNPGLVSSWFIVTGTLGLLLILNASLVSSAALTKEREAGTIEQLLMTPAQTTETIIAKILPLFCLLLLMALLAVGLARFVFQVPFRGSLSLVLFGAALCLLCGIGIGTMIATFSKSAQQSQLMSFFVNPPLASLSGALTPKEAMPHWMQPLTALNPIYHFGEIARGALLKGTTLGDLWPHLLSLTLFAVVCMTVSIWRFRKQLG